MIWTLIQKFNDEWINLFTSGYSTPEQEAVAVILRETARADILNYLFIDVPIEVSWKMIKTAVETTQLASIGEIKAVIEKLRGKSRSFYFDIYSQWKKGQSGETPFTPAVQLIFALDKAVIRFMEEGYEQRISRYKKLASKLREGLKKIGFETILLPEGMESNILTAVKMPEKMDYWKVHDKLKEEGITIYSDESVLKERKFRVATLGSIDEEDIDYFLKNLERISNELGIFER